MESVSSSNKGTNSHHEPVSAIASPERTPQQHIKAKEACLACRQTKVKCRPIDKDHAPPDTCSRCTRLKYECVYNQQKRGRKVGSKRKVSALNTDGRSPIISSKSSKTPSAHVRDSSSPSSSPPLSSSNTYPAVKPDPISPAGLPSSSMFDSSQSSRAYPPQIDHSRFNASGSSSLPSSYNLASASMYNTHTQPRHLQISSSFLSPGNFPVSGPEGCAGSSSSEPQNTQTNPSGSGLNMIIDRPPADARGAYNHTHNISGYPQSQSHPQSQPQLALSPYPQSERHRHLQRTHPYRHSQQHQPPPIAPSYGQAPQSISYPTDRPNPSYNPGPPSWFEDADGQNVNQAAYGMIGPSLSSVSFDNGAGGDGWSPSAGIEPSYIRTQIPFQPSSQQPFPFTDRSSNLNSNNNDHGDNDNSHKNHNRNNHTSERMPGASLPIMSIPDLPGDGLGSRASSRTSSITAYSLLYNSPANKASRSTFTPGLGESSSSGGVGTTPGARRTGMTGSAGSPASSSSVSNKSSARRTEGRGVLSLAEMLIERTDGVPKQESEEEESQQQESQSSQQQHNQAQLSPQLHQSQRWTVEEESASMSSGVGTDAGTVVGADKEGANGERTRQKVQLEPTKKTIGWEDPVGVGLVSVEQAVMMFETYHDYMNVFIDLLDPVLHTASFTRETSPVLFSAVLTASAKFVLPGIYPKLLDFTNNMLGRCFGFGVLEIGFIQALSILSFWKPATDNSSFRRVGYAIRLAYELNLHEPHARPLPDDEHEIRMIFDRERTWYQMACFDLTSHMQHDLPPMIDETLTGMEEWLSDEPRFHSPFDSMIVASYLLLRNFVGLNSLRKQKYDAEVTLIMLGHLREKVSILKEKLGDDTKFPMHSACRTVIMFYFAVITLDLDLLNISCGLSAIRFNMSTGGPANKSLATCSMDEIASFTRCIKSSLECLRRITEDMKPLIEFSQDTIVMAAVGAVTWLAKNFSTLPDKYRNEVIGALYNVQNVFQQVSKDSNDAYSYQAAFFQSVLLHCFMLTKRGSISRPDPVGRGINLSFTNTPQNGGPVPLPEEQQQPQQDQSLQLSSEQQQPQSMQSQQLDIMTMSNDNPPIFIPDTSFGVGWSMTLENPQMFDVRNNMSMDDLLGHFSDLAPPRHDVWPPS
ncbi:Zn(2)-C6 fungal-type DNA-binding domain [Phaffia rhodozyma]|uniref:Zn(2)-C6 fungal-type DNA-binding domain n=1 Tax=Phaffia rhodozyma TaxID=264483 RepID=A0A0F7SND4_PHARH|nr:Zn(2)-C6 fungal-type DNA-binding domain [Phaffia rhodozyma]